MDIEQTPSRIGLNDQVRFKDERLCLLSPLDRKRLEGRVGEVQGFWKFSTRKLTVYFPQSGSREDLRILSVDVRHLELVAPALPAPEPEAAPKLTDAAPADDGERKLSQSELDDLFG